MLTVSITAGSGAKQQTMKILMIIRGARGDVQPYAALETGLSANPAEKSR
jgi:hypothetical protein